MPGWMHSCAGNLHPQRSNSYVVSQKQRLVRKVKRRLARKLGFTERKQVRQSSHTPLFREFLAALEQKQEVPVSAQEARQSVELCTAIYGSALLRKPVDLPVQVSDQFYKGIKRDDYDHSTS